MRRPRICVVKLGGSLLARGDLPQQLSEWLAGERAQRPETHIVLIVGGGPLADAVRELQARTSMTDAAAHWTCVELLDVTAGIVGTMLPELAVVDRWPELLCRLREPGCSIFRPGGFLRDIEPTSDGTRLATGWSVTSDSIAARLAVALRADELVLIKSVPPPATGELDDLAELAGSGHVDAFLPRLAGEMPPLRLTVLREKLAATWGTQPPN